MVRIDGRTDNSHIAGYIEKSLLCEKFSTFSVLLFPDSFAPRTCECIMMTIKTQLKLHSLSIFCNATKRKERTAFEANVQIRPVEQENLSIAHGRMQQRNQRS